MKVEAYVFLVMGVFFAGVDVIYWYTSHDWTGTTCILLTMGLALLIGGYLAFTASRLTPRPEDRGDADVSDGAGEVGQFSPGSYWPVLLAFAMVTLSVGLVIGLWLVFLAASILVFALLGLLFENFVGQT